MSVAQVFPDICIGGDAALIELTSRGLGNNHWYIAVFKQTRTNWSFMGYGDRDTWLAFLDKLSTQFPAITIRFSGETDHGECEEWTVTGGERIIISASYKAVAARSDNCVCSGWRDARPARNSGWNAVREDARLSSSMRRLARICESEWHFFFPGRECPGVKSGSLFKMAEEFANRAVEPQ